LKVNDKDFHKIYLCIETSFSPSTLVDKDR
jgi:hypothetical protein